MFMESDFPSREKQDHKYRVICVGPIVSTVSNKRDRDLPLPGMLSWTLQRALLWNCAYWVGEIAMNAKEHPLTAYDQFQVTLIF